MSRPLRYGSPCSQLGKGPLWKLLPDDTPTPPNMVYHRVRGLQMSHSEKLCALPTPQQCPLYYTLKIFHRTLRIHISFLLEKSHNEQNSGPMFCPTEGLRGVASALGHDPKYFQNTEKREGPTSGWEPVAEKLRKDSFPLPKSVFPQAKSILTHFRGGGE